MRRIWFFCACLLVAGTVQTAQAQTLSNPDISLVGDMRFILRDSDTAAENGVNRAEFQFEELELNFAAYLNPYMRSDVFIGIHGTEGPVEVEEASITVLRGLPLSLQLKGGKYLTDFGRINQQHPHQWAWLQWPLMHRAQFGDEGLRTVGAQASTLIGVGETAVTLSLNAFRSDAFGHGHEEEEGHADADTAAVDEDEHGHGEAEAADIMGSARLSAFREFGDAWSAEFGVSGLYGTFDAAEDLKKRIAGIDVKLRWKPSEYRAFVWIAEAMLSDSDVETEAEGDTTGTAEPEITRPEAMGFFTMVEYQFARRFDAGGFFDWTEDAVEPDATTTAVGAFVGFMPVEDTSRFSVVYRRETSDLTDYTDNSLSVQLLWALGPHQPHTY